MSILKRTSVFGLGLICLLGSVASEAMEEAHFEVDLEDHPQELSFEIESEAMRDDPVADAWDELASAVDQRSQEEDRGFPGFIEDHDFGCAYLCAEVTGMPRSDPDTRNCTVFT